MGKGDVIIRRYFFGCYSFSHDRADYNTPMKNVFGRQQIEWHSIFPRHDAREGKKKGILEKKLSQQSVEEKHLSNNLFNIQS